MMQLPLTGYQRPDMRHGESDRRLHEQELQEQDKQLGVDE